MAISRGTLIQAHFVHGIVPVPVPMPGRDARPGTAQRRADANIIPLATGQLQLAGAVGRALPESVQRKMEAFFKADFSDVRIYQGPQAQSIGAHAFTMGSSIYFAPGQYSPDTARGQQLLGHELTHVLQQRAGRVRAPQGGGTVVVNDHALEAEADRMGSRAAAFRPAHVQAKLAPPGLPQRAQQAVALQARQAGHRLVVGAYMHQGAAGAGAPPDLAGHAFVSLQGPAGGRQTWGFSPENYSRYDPRKDLGKLRAGVPGVVHRDDQAFAKPGVKTRSYALSPAQAKAALAKVDEYRTRHYSFSAQSRQCTTFASDVLRAANVAGAPAGRQAPGDFYRKI
ncbi:hypothetical protein CSQ96_27760 [Janthinobacterium sp. BJB412]|nr:hypothetical protein CSQ96_27760 [Janthinobacterium sp. BJB412]